MEKNIKVVIADVVDSRFPKDKLKSRMEELENLVTTYGGVVIIKKIQKRGRPDYRTFIGGGKLDEIKQIMSTSNADVLILGNILKPYQIYNINQELKEIKAEARDRIDLILKIFAQHAKSPESKLQIELASIKHMGPRIFGMGMELSRQGGGIGTKGIGETNTEIMKRHLAKKVQQIENKLQNYEKVREQHRQSRTKKGLQTVGIVGYTNAGKSSLLNTLTGKGVLAQNKLFATLGTSVGEVFLSPYDLNGKKDYEWKDCKKVLLNDTIGFIQDLPPELIKSFQSTLEDSIESDILFHTIDISDDFIEDKINVVDDILDQIGAEQKKILIFNKVDKLNSIEEGKEIIEKIFKKNEIKMTENKDYFLVSTYTEYGLENIKKFLFNEF